MKKGFSFQGQIINTALQLSSVRLTSNKWIPVDTTLSYNMIEVS